jgi:hypothetical protein
LVIQQNARLPIEPGERDGEEIFDQVR